MDAAIVTDTEGLTTGDARVPTADGKIPAYWAKPSREGLLPVVLVVQEIFGVNDYIRDVCRRLAKQGYLAIAPELYARQGDTSKLTDIQEIISRVVSKVPDEQVMSDLDATAAWVVEHGLADPERLAITGFCWGGRIVWMYAAHSARLKAGAAWYGRLVGPRDALHPSHPVDVAASLHAPVLGLYGGQDSSIPPNTVEQMRAALEQATRPAEIIVYPDAGHAFHADYRPSYHQSAAQDAWTRMLAWFARYGTV